MFDKNKSVRQSQSGLYHSIEKVQEQIIPNCPDLYTPAYFAQPESSVLRQYFNADVWHHDAFVRYQEAVWKLFDEDETVHISDTYKEMVGIALASYPDYPYHQKAHSIDVMYNTVTLLDYLRKSGNEVTTDQRHALLLGAAFHDAKFTYDDRPDIAWKRTLNGKEGVAIQFFDETVDKQPIDKISTEMIEIVHQAILGTIIRPGEIQRNNQWGRLLHHADLGYLWGDTGSFVNYAMRFRVEECGQMSWGEFQLLEQNFLTGYKQILADDLAACGLMSQITNHLVARVQDNLDVIVGLAQEPDLATFQRWPSLRAETQTTVGELDSHVKLGVSAVDGTIGCPV